MEIFITLSKWILAPLFSIIITLLLAEPIKERLIWLLSRFGSKHSTGISGTWRATFYMGNPTKAYTEHIKLTSRFGIFIGTIEPHSDNYDALKKVEHDRPVRLRGYVKNDRFFDGVWLHPIKRSHHSGSFELLIEVGHDKMSGLWLGYSETRNAVESQRWVWERIDD